MTDAPRICMVGSSLTDMIARVKRLPEPGETVHGYGFRVGFGGKGANQAVMAARLGAQVSVVTKLGRDTFGEETLFNFRHQGIDTTHVLFDERLASGVALIAVDDQTGQNSIVMVPGANDALTPAEVREASETITAAQIVLCQFEIPLEATITAFRIARAASVTTLFNPAPAPTVTDEALTLTDILIPNELEIEMLVGRRLASDDQLVAAARELQTRGPRVVVITLGSRGALVVDGDAAPEWVATEQVRAVDTTGAGDAFVGSFAYLLAGGRTISDAAHRACAIATKTVLAHGTQSSFPTREQVAGLLGGFANGGG
ncbi:MAG: ribokinase [Anaerolineae bacterium]